MDNNLFCLHKDNNDLIKRNYYKDFLNQIIKKLSFIIPAIILMLLFFTGFILSNFINLDKQMIVDINKAYVYPCLKYPFGTNSVGQNQLPIILIGTYKTLLLAFIATFINLILGIVIGVLWGSSNKVNSFMFVIKHLVDNTPIVFFYIIIVTLLGDGFLPLLLVIILFGWLEFASIIRNTLVIIKAKDYNKVSKLYKVPLYKVAINNYLPAILPILFNNVALCVPKIIALEIIISYFGFSFGGSHPSLGMLLYSCISNNTYFTHHYMFLIPFIFLFAINLCVFFISKTISNNCLKEEI